VQAQHVGDLAQHHRPHRHLAVLEEARCRSTIACDTPQDRLEALGDVADHPLRLLQLRRELLVRGFAVAGQDVGVDAVEAQPGHRRLVERRHPLAAHLLYDHVGDDIVRGRVANDAPGRGLSA